ncbi:AsmA family protein [Leptospira ognonensis]|uniref:AsmA family protein n=1 Tax=Leptospira ognonensis TaxID=2484945 RepID=A0A4R9JUF5_9LEPT|nr:AsmA family protein [Leptospira ognonensis]TGL56453.1 AsmA family protein [Leptospira ognonensis]
MIITFGERIKGYVGKLFLGGLFIFSMSSFFLLYPLISEPDYYKNLILNLVNQQSGLTFDYKESEPELFPFPGISLHQVTVSKADKKLIQVERVTIQIFYGVLIGKELEIRSIILNTGNIELKREKDESFPLLSKFLEPNDLREKDKSTSSEILTYLEVFGDLPHRLELKNINIVFDDRLYNRVIKLYIWECNTDLDLEKQSIDFSLYGKLNEETIQLYIDANFLNNLLSYENLRFEGSIDFQNFSGENLTDIAIIFPYVDLKSARLNGVVPFYKRTSTTVAAKFERAHLQNLARKGSKPFLDAYISVLISYDNANRKLAFDDISAEWKGKIKINGSGFVTFDKPPLSPTISFEGRSDYIDADSVINLIKLWIEADLEKSLLTRGMEDTNYVNRMNVHLNFNLKNANLRGVFADNLNLSFHYHKSQMRIQKINAWLYGGSLNAVGSFFWGSSPRLELTGKADSIILADLLKHQFDIAPMTGNLESQFELNALGNSEDALVKTLKIKSDFKSKDGELLSYTNILKPVSSIGNLISLKKLDFSKSTPYKEISVGMLYHERKFQFSNFQLKADGLTAKGEGDISLDKKINMKFTIALPGLAGRALKLPIIYSGIYGVNSPYIDPIWLGSVYAGTILLAGPAGATVGGIAGSAVSEYVNRAVDNVTDTVQSGWSSVRGKLTQIFSSESKPEQK